MTKQPCSVPNCDRPAYRTGLCSGHYERKIGRSKKPMDAPLGKVVSKCLHASCTEMAKVKGYCEFHYRRKLAGIDLDAETSKPILERFQTGTKFGRLSIVKYLGPDARHRKWFLCKCDCGNEIKAHSGSLLRKNTQSCGCLARDVKAGKRLPDDWGVIHHLILQYRRHAVSRGLSFELGKADFRELVDAPCHYCGSVESNLKITKNHSGYAHNGIDRKDSALGYSKDNCVPCCRTCNFAKRDMPYAEFISWLDRVAEFRRKT